MSASAFPHPMPSPPAHPPSSSLPSDPSLLSHLQLMFSLLGKHDWINSFLFNPDPAHLTCLTAPCSTNNALTCVASITRFSTSSPSPPQHLDASFVFIPAFSVDSVSVGFGMQKNDFSATSPCAFLSLPCEVAFDKEHFRYVRDDASATLVMIYDHPEQSFVRMEHISHQSSTCRVRSFCIFDRDKFNSIRKSNPSFKSQPLLQALKLVQVTREYRDCPYCSKPHSAACTCKLDLDPPRHSLDFQNGLKHMTSHVGTFQGTATLKHLNNGIVCTQTVLRTRMEVRGGAMPELVSTLTKWALSQQANHVPPPNPVASLFPSPDDAQVNVGQDLDFLLFDSLQSAVKQPLPDTKPQDSFGVQPFQFLKDVAPDFGNSESERVDLLPELFNPSFNFNSEFAEPALQDQSVAKILGWKPDSFGMHPTASDADQMLDINRFFENEHALKVVEEERPAKRARVAVVDDVDKSESATTLERETSIGNPENESEHVKESLPNVKTLTREQEEALRTKEMKRQQKIQRNRASARRSNEKKKRENDERKRQKKELLAKVAELREKEMRLRTENLELRSLVMKTKQ